MNEQEPYEYAGKKDIFIGGFDARVLIVCPRCNKQQNEKVLIMINDIEFKQRIINFICKTPKCNFRSTFLFYLGLELT